ncbi:hypothetical protein [Wolbachia endosymbiont (group B) of Ennomos erosarius]|uniref:hypothetical protein n=1 Tax=Wolbachia endosymbiont (group B) of Ennomos erosarius TaxID=3066175 RepID=UPI003132E9CF
MVNLICFFITAEFTLFSCLFYSPLIQNSRFKNSNLLFVLINLILLKIAKALKFLNFSRISEW